jgi:hypothetical protein
MKQLLFSCSLTLAAWVILGGAEASAQTSFGLHGGLNYGKTHLDKFPEYDGDYTPGFFVGATVRRQLPKRFGAALDAQFALKASKNKLLGQPDLESQYLEIAPRAEWFFTKNIGVSLGFYASYLLEQRAEFGNGVWVRTDKGLFAPNRWDAGIAPGVSLRFGRAFGFLRYTHGLAAVEKIEYTNDQGESSGTARLFNRYFQAGAGYVIFE